MKARFPVLAPGIATLLVVSALTHSPAHAAAVDQCNRACLNSIVEKYVGALRLEIFRINGAGQISQVEAVMLSVPYGMRPGFSTGTHMPSPQAQKNGFREY